MEQQAEKRIEYKDLKVGERLSRTQYYQVKEISNGWGTPSLTVENEWGFSFTINGREIVENEMCSAEQFTETEKVTRTELAELLETAGDAIFTVCFSKQVKEKDAKKALESFLDQKGRKTELKKKVKDLAKQVLGGEERKLIGYLLRTEPKMGRSQVIDLEIDKDKHRIRLVDHRTLRWLILKGVKYEVKK